ncbi:hypothetical protein cyc_01281 [Cyclospora cayetanensis]|uniref:Uncharacterized protein n=1 Tax=Cyclospora cayetanensis TaxID=88456 RepID=A0A1D3D9G8_9EIME|nr:hypothetical protein cyc_01281 [Cyclospora cayetanensis]
MTPVRFSVSQPLRELLLLSCNSSRRGTSSWQGKLVLLSSTMTAPAATSPSWGLLSAAVSSLLLRGSCSNCCLGFSEELILAKGRCHGFALPAALSAAAEALKLSGVGRGTLVVR